MVKKDTDTERDVGLEKNAASGSSEKGARITGLRLSFVVRLVLSMQKRRLLSLQLGHRLAQRLQLSRQPLQHKSHTARSYVGRGRLQ